MKNFKVTKSINGKDYQAWVKVRDTQFWATGKSRSGAIYKLVFKMEREMRNHQKMADALDIASDRVAKKY